MPVGSFDFSPYPPQLALDAVQIGVFQYFSVSKQYQLLPNIRCEQIQYKEGPVPPTARFSYILDELAAIANGWPTEFQQVWPLNSGPAYGSYVVTPSMQLVVLALLPDGTTRILFHGFARVPQTDVTPGSQHVNFTAVGAAVRAWDTPIGGRVQRDSAAPQSGTSKPTDMPVRFNPSGTGTRAVGGILPNCTPDGQDVNQNGPNVYPVFLDSSIDRSPDPRTSWNLSKAVRYILGVYNTGLDPAGNPWVENPEFTALDTLLQNRQPKSGTAFFDPTDPATYTTEPNIIRDFDATNKAWPDVVGQLLGFHGYAMQFLCQDDGTGFPVNSVDIYRKDAAGPTSPKAVYLPTTGTALAKALANLSALHAGFDFHGVANSIFVESHLERYEISVILAPGFVPESGDGDAANKTQFLKSNIDTPTATAAQRNAYRYYVVDECGDGYYDIATEEWVTNNPFNFTPLLFSEEFPDEPDYVKRYRPGKGTLFSKDLQNRPYKAQLAVATQQTIVPASFPPVFITPQENALLCWQEVNPSGWNLLPDRLGVRITAPDVQRWHIGAPRLATIPMDVSGPIRRA